MHGAVAERRREDFWQSRCAIADIFTHTWSGRERICHFVRTKMVWSVRFRSGRCKLGIGLICCGADFASAPPPLRDHVCVNACSDLCWSQFPPAPARVHCGHVWTYLKLLSSVYMNASPHWVINCSGMVWYVFREKLSSQPIMSYLAKNLVNFGLKWWEKGMQMTIIVLKFLFMLMYVRKWIMTVKIYFWLYLVFCNIF